MNDGNGLDSTRTPLRVLTPEEFLEKLRTALSRNGDFPASAKIVTELRMLTSDPQTTANQIAEVILREPTLGVRVLHLVNSSFYKRAKPITTISQAIVQIGMKPLAEMCAGLVLLQKFVPEARKGSAFAYCLRKSIVTSLLTSSLALHSTSESQGKTTANKNAESGYLAGTLAEMGVLLMAYYFPQVYENAVKRSEQKGVDVSVCIQQLIGVSVTELSCEVIRTLNLPQYYSDIVSAAHKLSVGEATSSTVSKDIVESGRYLGAAIGISEAVASGQSSEMILAAINRVQSTLNIKPETLQLVVNSLPQQLEDHCAALQVSLPELDPQLTQLEISGTSMVRNQTASVAAAANPALGAQQTAFDEYVNDIKLAISNNDPTASIVTSVMEVCAYCLKFDRVMLLLASQGRRALVGRMVLGQIPGVDPTKFSRPIDENADPYAPDVKSFTTGIPVFQGDPLFEGGWPIAAIPIGSGKKAVGVVYAERVGDGTQELTGQEQAAIAVLANLLDKAVQRAANKIS